MTTEARIQRVTEAIEGCPDAIDHRSNALARFIAEDIDGAVDECHAAARAVIAADPDLALTVSLAALSAYLGSQVRALATGDDAILYLLPLAN